MNSWLDQCPCRNSGSNNCNAYSKRQDRTVRTMWLQMWTRTSGSYHALTQQRKLRPVVKVCQKENLFNQPSLWHPYPHSYLESWPPGGSSSSIFLFFLFLFFTICFKQIVIFTPDQKVKQNMYLFLGRNMRQLGAYLWNAPQRHINCPSKASVGRRKQDMRRPHSGMSYMVCGGHGGDLATAGFIWHFLPS